MLTSGEAQTSFNFYFAHPLYGLKKAKRPVRAKALIINAFALTGRIVFGGFLPQGVALGYVLIGLSARIIGY